MQFFLKQDKLEKEIRCCMKAYPYLLSRSGELVLQTRAQCIVQVEWITGLVKVSTSPSPGTLLCRSLKNADDQIVPFSPGLQKGKWNKLYEGSLELGHERLFVSIFYDSYLSAPTRYKSVGGLYLSIMNMMLKHQRKLENVQLLCLVPNGACFNQVWERYRKELVVLGTNGLSYHHPKTGALVSCKVRLGMVKADSPQRTEFCDHVAGNADLFCPKCSSRKFDLWDIDFPVLKHHYPPGFLSSYISLKSQLPPEQQDGLKKKYGFHGSYDMFRDLPFTPGAQMPGEPYHLWILGCNKSRFPFSTPFIYSTSTL